jgi:diaminohydroxyphosphoribosylaminopyrimidine deaminase/5-amino-6-(5-phosphoribosylamino)uracil reductase
MSDETWMRRALDLAARGRGAVEPNPMVGAVVVRDGVVVGEGWHQKYGGPHAEVFALNAAGEAARGATLHVSLEPCCHLGKTPPCTDAVSKAGVARVVAAMQDPFPRVAGQGEAILRSAGIAVEVGVCETEARSLNAPYLKLVGKGRPWVIAKWAMTLDGKIATRTGDSKWISNESSRRIVHELRGRVDAVIVGIGTALADDPLLTARPPGPRVALRVVMDRTARLPLTSRLVQTAHETPTLIVCDERLSPSERREALRQAGCAVMAGECAVGGLLDELGRQRLTNVLVEGGSGVLGAFLDAGEIDEVHAFVAPRLAGGATAITPIGGTGAETIGQALTLHEQRVEQIGGDVYVTGRIARGP